jgi:hypothetical protein
MTDNIKEFVNADGKLISSKVPNTDPKTTAKTTTDKSMKMRAQPFMYTVYRRFFSESELPHTKKADEMKNDPKGFHQYLKSLGEGDKFESYFQKDPKAALDEVAKEKAYKMMETLFTSKKDETDVLSKKQITIDEIRGKEQLLVDKLSKIAETIKHLMSEDEKKVLLSYFSQKIK